ncbi:MAG: hypothetical protein LBI61_03385 [Puniceicoccales bacterium]|nr:hypothetical protein [Puniceicoccales bacterium]
MCKFNALGPGDEILLKLVAADTLLGEEFRQLVAIIHLDEESREFILLLAVSCKQRGWHDATQKLIAKEEEIWACFSTSNAELLA